MDEAQGFRDPLLDASKPPGYVPPTFSDSEGVHESRTNEKGVRIFASRDELDSIIFWDRGDTVTIDGVWHKLDKSGKHAKDSEGRFLYTNQVWVPRVNGEMVDKVTSQIATIIAVLFPHRTTFFMSQLNFDQPMAASAELNQILFGTVYGEIKEVVQVVLGLPDEQFSLFIRMMFPVDIIKIFCQIVNQEINSPQMEALHHQIQSLLVERFRLESVLQQFLESTQSELLNAGN